MKKIKFTKIVFLFYCLSSITSISSAQYATPIEISASGGASIFGGGALNTWEGSWKPPQALWDRGSYQDSRDYWYQTSGSEGSTWGSASSGGYGILVIDLGQIRTLNRFKVFQMFSDGKTTHIQIYRNSSYTSNTAPKSTDGGWVDVTGKQVVYAGGNGSTYIHTPTDISTSSFNTRYLKLHVYNDGRYGSTSYIELKGIKGFYYNGSWSPNYLRGGPSPPEIYDFSPTGAASSQTVTITGRRFLRTSAVTFGNVPAQSFSVIDNTKIEAVVNTGSTGSIEITTPFGTHYKSGFTFLQPPSGLSYSPSTINATYGQSITTVTPTVTGTVNSYSISSPLPSGLFFNTTTGAISGTPTTVAAQKNYTVTATNTSGSTSTTVSITVNKAQLTVKANNQSETYNGQVFSGFSVNYTGFKNGDDATDLSGSLSFTGDATSATQVGTYTITPQGLTANNYNITFSSGTLSINKKLLTITADNKTKVYNGLVFSGFTASYAGFEGTDDESVLTGTLSFTGSATSATQAGTHTITPQGLSADNYNLDFVDGTLTITKKSLSITADDKTMVYNANTYFGFTVSYSGFEGTDDEAVLSGTLSFTGDAASETGVGNHTITPQGLSANNYDITFNSGTLTITKKILTVVADNKTTVYNGSTFSSFTVSYNGFEGTDNETNLTGSLSFTGDATSATEVGNYTIAPDGLASDNYDITFNTGTLTITKKLLTITADDKSMVYNGSTFTSFTVSYSGFEGTDDESNLTGSLSFTGDATSATEVGNYTITPEGLASDNYDLVFADGTLTITKKLLTITADDKTMVYNGNTFSGFTVSYAGFEGTDNETNLTGSLSFTGNATSATEVGNYTITPQGLASDNYNITFNTGTLTITKKLLTITADDQSMVYNGTTFTSFTVSYAGFEGTDNESNLTGSLSFTGDATSATEVGNYTITPQGLASDNYNITFNTGTLTITKKLLTITADDKSMVYNENTFSGFTVSYAGFEGSDNESNLTGALSFTGDATSATEVGNYTITPDGLASDNYDITFNTGTLTITKKLLTITADDKSMVYNGSTFTSFTVSYAGFEGTDNESNLTGALSFTGDATSATEVGTYTITPDGLASDNYDLVFADGTLTITKKLLTITADDQSMVYNGSTFTSFTVSYAGFEGTDNESSLTGALAFTGDATSATEVGNYTITPDGLASDNYDLVFADGTLTITKKLLTITADDKTMVYNGNTFSGFTVSYTGFEGTDDESNLTGALSFTGDATSATQVGNYTITLQGLASDNYDITFNDGTLTITKKLLTVTADDKSMVYNGSTFTSFTVSYAGFEGTDNESNLTGALSFTGDATSATQVGTYTITPDGLASDNYDLVFADGTLTITKKLLTITADDKTMVYNGNTFSGFTVSYTGFEGTDNESNLTGALNFTGDATSATEVGSYTITPQGLASDNYDITFNTGTLTITKKLLTVVADDKTTVYNGSTFTPFTVSYSGFEGTDNKSNLTGALSFTGNATSATEVGTYTITPEGLASDNYDITFNTGTLTITKKLLTITADDKSMVYDGSTFTSFTVSYSGFEGSDNESNLTGSLSFTGDATSATEVGTYTITPKGLASDNYDLVFADGILTITKKLLTITADDQSMVYNGTTFTSFTVSYAGFEGSDNESNLTGALSFTGDATSATEVGNYTITPGGLASDNYDLVFADGTLTITKKLLTITADDKSVVYDGSTYTSFTVSYSGFEGTDEESNLTGSLIFSGDATSATEVGTYTITPKGLASDNYDLVFADGILTITKKLLTITADDQSMVYDGSTFASFTVSSAGFEGIDDESNLTGTLSFIGDAVSATQVGNYTITPQGLASDNYDLVFADGTLSISKKLLTITADDQSMVYNGGTFTSFTVSYAGFEGTDNESNLTGSLAFTGDATSATEVGNYTITPQGLASDNYDLVFADGTLTITKKLLTITADDQSMVYDGSTFASFTVSYAGFEGTDNESNLTGSLIFSGDATSATEVGTYTITPKGLASDNYDLVFADGILTITKKLLTITADDQSMVYDGSTFASFTVSYAGFEGIDDESNLTGTLSFIGDAVSATQVGNYTITPQGLASDNYDLVFADGTLSISKKLLTITADDQSMVYNGGTFTSFTVSYAGFEGTDNESNLTGSLAFTGDATSATEVGNYTITPQGLASDNYDLVFADGTLTITKKLLTITADDQSMVYNGNTFSGFTVSYSGFEGTDNEMNLTGALSFTGNATSATEVGTYTITPVGLASDNYNITFNTGTLTITKKLLTVTADDKTTVYNRSTFTSFAVSYSDFEGSDNETNLTGSLSFTGNATSATEVGTYTITPQGLASDNYDLVFADGTLTITKKLLTITADDKTMVYKGTTFTSFTVSYSGFEGSDNETNLTGTLSFTGDATTASQVGNYSITPEGLASDNYDLVFADGTLTITKKLLTITADNKNMVYNGNIFSGFTVSYSGFEGTDNESNPTGSLNFTGDATSATDVGNYTITPQGLAADNYDITFNTGTLTITKKPLTVTADDKTKKQGEINPPLTITYSGFENGEDQSYLLVEPIVTTTIDTDSPIGVYPEALTASGGQDDNYNFQYVAGEFTIVRNTIPVTITLKDLEQTYDGSPKIISASTDPPAISLSITYNGQSRFPVNVGEYDVVAVVVQPEYEGTVSGTFKILRDTDKDGFANIYDSDDDNDGVPDNLDAFPTNPAETSDSDGDGVGDNSDAFPDDPDITTDDTAPEIHCVDYTILVNTNENYFLSEEEINLIARGNEVIGFTSDNTTDYDNLEISISQDSFSSADIGTQINVTIYVTDEYGNRGECESTISVEGNHPPETIYQPASLYIEENNTLRETFSSDIFQDIDDADSLRYQMYSAGGSSLPSWVYFNDQIKEINLSPRSGDRGTYQFVLAATDRAGSTAEATVGVIVGFTTNTEDYRLLTKTTVYPNPTTGLVHIDGSNIIGREVEIIIRNINGQGVYKQNHKFSPDPLLLDLSNYLDGNYFIQMKMGSSLQTKQIILKK